jgi:glycogen debranching enzyme
VSKIETSNEEFYRLFRQALEDMAALRLPIAGTDHLVFLPAAGLPGFVAPFGRDSLIVSLQNTLIYLEFAQGALEILGTLHAKEVDDYRDAEPDEGSENPISALILEELLVPNEETIAAIKAVERGEVKTFNTIDELFEDLHSDADD